MGKATHWVSVLNDEGEEVLSRRVQAAELVAEAGELLSGTTVRPIGWPPRPASPRS